MLPHPPRAETRRILREHLPRAYAVLTRRGIDTREPGKGGNKQACMHARMR